MTKKVSWNFRCRGYFHQRSLPLNTFCLTAFFSSSTKHFEKLKLSNIQNNIKKQNITFYTLKILFYIQAQKNASFNLCTYFFKNINISFLFDLIRKMSLEDPESERTFSERLRKCGICQQEDLYLIVPCGCEVPIHRACLKGEIYRKIQYDNQVAQRIYPGVSKTYLQCQKCKEKVRFIVVCSDVQAGVGAARNICWERKKDIALSLIILIVVWAVFVGTVFMLQEVLTFQYYTEEKFYAILGLILFGLFAVFLTLYEILGLFTVLRKINARIEIPH